MFGSSFLYGSQKLLRLNASRGTATTPPAETAPTPGEIIIWGEIIKLRFISLQQLCVSDPHAFSKGGETDSESLRAKPRSCSLRKVKPCMKHHSAPLLLARRDTFLDSKGKNGGRKE
ncbi:hypothetical protein AOLI_G00219570 [Acnodon oligacanthus]